MALYLNSRSSKHYCDAPIMVGDTWRANAHDFHFRIVSIDEQTLTLKYVSAGDEPGEVQTVLIRRFREENHRPVFQMYQT